MNIFLNAIQNVSGPLTLLAFLAVILLAVYRISVKDEKGLEYLFKLFQEKLTRNQFYALASQIVNRVFWGVLLVFALSLFAFVKVNIGEDASSVKSASSGDTIVTGDQSIVVTGGGDANVGLGQPLGRDVIVSQGEGNTLVGEEPGSVIVSGKTAGRARVANPFARIGDKERLSPNYRIDISPEGFGSLGLRELYKLKNICEVDKHLCSQISIECEDFESICQVYDQWCIKDIPRDTRFNTVVESLEEDPDSFCSDRRKTCANNGKMCREYQIPPMVSEVYGFFIPWGIANIDLKHTDTWSSSPVGNATQEVHIRPNSVVSLVGFVTNDQAVKLDNIKQTEVIDLVLYPIPHRQATRAVSIPLARITHFIHGRMDKDFNGPSSNEIRIR